MEPQRKRLAFDLTVWITAPLLSFSLLALDADAGSRAPLADNATWRIECSGCHVPYPATLLPAQAWRQIMGTLDRHFGTDASVDAKAMGEIAAFLEANAGRDRSGATQTEPRITTSSRFLRKHHEVAPATFRSTAVGSASNCAACHPGAARGDFDEHAVRIPRGQGVAQ